MASACIYPEIDAGAGISRPRSFGTYGRTCGLGRLQRLCGHRGGALHMEVALDRHGQLTGLFQQLALLTNCRESGYNNEMQWSSAIRVGGVREI